MPLLQAGPPTSISNTRPTMDTAVPPPCVDRAGVAASPVSNLSESAISLQAFFSQVTALKRTAPT